YDVDDKQAAAEAIGMIGVGTDVVYNVLDDAVRNGFWVVKISALNAVSQLADNNEIPTSLIKTVELAVNDKNEHVKIAAKNTLKKLLEIDGYLEIMKDLLDDENLDQEIKQNLVNELLDISLENTETAEMIAVLLVDLYDNLNEVKWRDVQKEIVRVLGEIEGLSSGIEDKVVTALKNALLTNSYEEVKLAARESLINRLGIEGYADYMKDLLNSDNENYRLNAVLELGDIALEQGGALKVEILKTLVEHFAVETSSYIRVNLIEVINRIINMGTIGDEYLGLYHPLITVDTSSHRIKITLKNPEQWLVYEYEYDEEGVVTNGADYEIDVLWQAYYGVVELSDDFKFGGYSQAEPNGNLVEADIWDTFNRNNSQVTSRTVTINFIQPAGSKLNKAELEQIMKILNAWSIKENVDTRNGFSQVREDEDGRLYWINMTGPAERTQYLNVFEIAVYMDWFIDRYTFEDNSIDYGGITSYLGDISDNGLFAADVIASIALDTYLEDDKVDLSPITEMGNLTLLKNIQARLSDEKFWDRFDMSQINPDDVIEPLTEAVENQIEIMSAYDNEIVFVDVPARLDTDSFTLRWKEVPEATHYQIFRSDNTAMMDMDYTRGQFWPWGNFVTQYELDNGAYYYRIKAWKGVPERGGHPLTGWSEIKKVVIDMPDMDFVEKLITRYTFVSDLRLDYAGITGYLSEKGSSLLAANLAAKVAFDSVSTTTGFSPKEEIDLGVITEMGDLELLNGISENMSKYGFWDKFYTVGVPDVQAVIDTLKAAVEKQITDLEKLGADHKRIDFFGDYGVVSSRYFKLDFGNVEGAQMYQVLMSKWRDFRDIYGKYGRIQRWPAESHEEFEYVNTGAYYVKVKAWSAAPEEGGVPVTPWSKVIKVNVVGPQYNIYPSGTTPEDMETLPGSWSIDYVAPDLGGSA
ncbi:HEAT repeat domain-containing protein, partial [Elusimicrobiota bacterium]